MNRLRKFIRLKNWPEFFGYSPTQIENRIKSGELPTPYKLFANARASGCFEDELIEAQNQLPGARAHPRRRSA